METEGRKRYRTRDHNTTTPSPDLLLNWGNRKRLRCINLQSKDDGDDASAGVKPETVASAKTCRADRRSTRSVKYSGKCVLRRVASPTRQRVLRNSEAAGMATAKGNEGSRGAAVKSPERGKAGVGATASEEKKSGIAGGSSSGSEGTVWPKFEMALTTKEKEEDFLVFKGSKLPQRPKKRAKNIQKTINLVSPGAWLCDLTLERYEVREKKISKKKPRGLKAMGNMENDSE